MGAANSFSLPLSHWAHSCIIFPAHRCLSDPKLANAHVDSRLPRSRNIAEFLSEQIHTFLTTLRGSSSYPYRWVAPQIMNICNVPVPTWRTPSATIAPQRWFLLLCFILLMASRFWILLTLFFLDSRHLSCFESQEPDSKSHEFQLFFWAAQYLAVTNKFSWI